ncbi:MAG: ATP-binding cassette domain-containing protein, partial [Eubacteriales bacterium]|nr:ATP-binding cassette domain-containing protein [Eubacteriales bacterium]
MIELKNVKKQYSEKVKIGTLDLVIPAAGLTSIIGPNGAGKSTMLLMIGRLLGMDEGAINVAGMDVTEAKSDDL